MKYKLNNLEYKKFPQDFSKNTQKELLQYAVGPLLYIPATHEKLLEAILKTREASICIDLEDAIGDNTVQQAELNILSCLQQLKTMIASGEITLQELPLIFTRIRSSQQLKDFGTKLGKPLLNLVTGFNLPKFDTSCAQDYLTAFHEVQHLSQENLYFMPIFETEAIMNKKGRIEELEALYQTLKPVQHYILNIRVGATDFSNLFGIRRTISQTIHMVQVIEDCLGDIINIFGKDYVCSAPVWEYFGSNDSDFKETPAWLTGLKNEIVLDQLNGFIGKTCIHPSQLHAVLESLVISEEDYEDALKILGMDETLVGVTKGHLGNKMNEVKTHIKWAKKMINLATIYGVRKSN